ncbi:MAG: hypothetical protein H6Q60_48 [Oscillospiraceae bacterium]|nr:hypothetical protein [Oscillospiraceae bacterium]
MQAERVQSGIRENDPVDSTSYAGITRIRFKAT